MLKIWSSFPLLTHYNTQACYTSLEEFVTQENDDSLFKSRSCSTYSSPSSDKHSIIFLICNPNPTMP